MVIPLKSLCLGAAIMRKPGACRIATVTLGLTLDAGEQYLIDLTN
jgi:hypothetical protein